MFQGSLPKPMLAQIQRVFPLDRFPEIYVCCSGAFRIEQMLLEQQIAGKVISNDVSLLSWSIGRLAASGDAPPFEFCDRLAFVEPLLVGAKSRTRVAALLVAGEMGKYTAANPWAESHFAHYQEKFADYLPGAQARVEKLLASIRVSRFELTDFREHAREAIRRGAAILAYPPTAKGAYEKLYKFVHTNITWSPPAYGIFDPRELEAWVLELEEAKAAFCVVSDQRFVSVAPIGTYDSTSSKSLHLYASGAKGSAYERAAYVLKPFKYEIVEPKNIRADSLVQIIPADAGMMNFLKERFLATGIHHTAGQLNFLVYIDGKLAGGYIYNRAKHDPTKTLYLLSDFSASRERRISKLIAMLASCKRTVAIAEKKLLIAVQSLVTTAFTDKPISMKYRGIYELTGRGPGHLQYASKVRDQDPQEIYREWYARHASAA